MPACSRRDVIQLGARGFLLLSATLPFLHCADAPGSTATQKINWQRFMDQLAKLAKQQHNKTWDQPGYLNEVRDLLLQCDIDDAHVQKVITSYRNAHKKFPEIRDLHRDAEVQVCLLEFEPGERIALHDHPDMTGCIRCISGKVVVRNFTELGAADQAKHVRLRHEATLTMTPGTTGMLTSTTGNLHDLQANEFTRLIDVFTPSYNDDRSKRSRWFNLKSQPHPTTKECIATVRG